MWKMGIWNENTISEAVTSYSVIEEKDAAACYHQYG